MKNLMDYVASQNETPQSEPVPGSSQVPNSASGYSWAVDDWVRLDRFLVLGSEGGTYYISQKDLTRENAQAVTRCIEVDGQRAVARIVEISEAGRAPKNDPAIFALALAATLGDKATKRAAFDAIPQVCRTGTHLFHFAAFVDGLRGWGRGLREGVAAWYAMPARKLALQAVKYGQRDGWTHRDLLRLAHPRPATPQHKAILHWIVKGWEGVGEEPHPDEALRLIWASEHARRASSAGEIIKLVGLYDLPREAVPTQWLDNAIVWGALLRKMPMEAMVRNLAKMTQVGLLTPMSRATATVAERLRDPERLRASRIHPLKLLAALKTYEQGHGERGKLQWQPLGQVVDALNDAFYLSFGNVEPSGKRWLLALDVSASMGWNNIAGMPGITPRVASAAMAMVTAAAEPAHSIVAFTANADGRYGGSFDTGEPELKLLDVSPKQRLDDVVATVSGLQAGGTDCALPMKWALQQGIEADVFVVYTDSETWAGTPHPAQALQAYRQKTGIPAKLVVVGMLSNGFSIADPNDAGMLDVVGFDTATPQVMSDFATH